MELELNSGRAITKKDLIPEIPGKRLMDLAKIIRPLARKDSEELYYIEPCDWKNVVFLWAPRLTQKALDLTQLAVIETYHTYGYHGSFNPGISEVLAQIPEKYLTNTVAFEVTGPKKSEDLNRQMELRNAGYHLATTVLYKKRESS